MQTGHGILTVMGVEIIQIFAVAVEELVFASVVDEPVLFA